MADHEDSRDWVGPVLQKGALSDAIIAAICELNEGTRIVDRGSYVRVLSPLSCRVTREAVERRAGEPFRLPGDLELVMSSFKGRLVLTEDEAVWQLSERAGS